jgi:hypothetical protein
MHERKHEHNAPVTLNHHVNPHERIHRAPPDLEHIHGPPLALPDQHHRNTNADDGAAAPGGALYAQYTLRVLDAAAADAYVGHASAPTRVPGVLQRRGAAHRRARWLLGAVRAPDREPRSNRALTVAHVDCGPPPWFLVTVQRTPPPRRADYHPRVQRLDRVDCRTARYAPTPIPCMLVHVFGAACGRSRAPEVDVAWWREIGSWTEFYGHLLCSERCS